MPFEGANGLSSGNGDRACSLGDAFGHQNGPSKAISEPEHDAYPRGIHRLAWPDPTSAFGQRMEADLLRIGSIP